MNKARALESVLFSAYGDVIGVPDADEPIMINNGLCERFHNLAGIEADAVADVGFSLFRSQSCSLPLTLESLERHPLASQTFIPMSDAPFLITVAEDLEGKPGTPLTFRTNGKQGVSIHRSVWHGVLSPLTSGSLYAVIDYVGKQTNLEVYQLDIPYVVDL